MQANLSKVMQPARHGCLPGRYAWSYWEEEGGGSEVLSTEKMVPAFKDLIKRYALSNSNCDPNSKLQELMLRSFAVRIPDEPLTDCRPPVCSCSTQMKHCLVQDHTLPGYSSVVRRDVQKQAVTGCTTCVLVSAGTAQP